MFQEAKLWTNVGLSPHAGALRSSQTNCRVVRASRCKHVVLGSVHEEQSMAAYWMTFTVAKVLVHRFVCSRCDGKEM